MLASVARVSREGAKQRFLFMAYDGSLQVWRQAHAGVELPVVVRAFGQEQRANRKEGAQQHPDLLKQLARRGRIEVTLHSQLNIKCERDVLDGTASTVQGCARPGR